MECSICYSEINAATGKVELSCSHPFHFSCLTKWFDKQRLKKPVRVARCVDMKRLSLRKCLMFLWKKTARRRKVTRKATVTRILQRMLLLVQQVFGARLGMEDGY